MPMGMWYWINGDWDDKGMRRREHGGRGRVQQDVPDRMRVGMRRRGREHGGHMLRGHMWRQIPGGR